MLQDLHSHLQHYLDTRGVTAAIAASSDGLVLDSAVRAGATVDCDGYAAAGASFLQSLSVFQQFIEDSPRVVTIEFSKSLLSGVLAGGSPSPSAVLLVVSDANANLGMLRLMLQRLQGEFLEIIKELI